jgi:hypothetical protein
MGAPIGIKQDIVRIAKYAEKGPHNQSKASAGKRWPPVSARIAPFGIVLIGLIHFKLLFFRRYHIALIYLVS